MSRDKDHNPDPNKNAARIVAESTSVSSDGLPADVEAAWAVWSAGIQKVDERGRTLLMAAFEAGFEAARSSVR